MTGLGRRVEAGQSGMKRAQALLSGVEATESLHSAVEGIVSDFRTSDDQSHCTLVPVDICSLHTGVQQVHPVSLIPTEAPVFRIDPAVKRSLAFCKPSVCDHKDIFPFRFSWRMFDFSQREEISHLDFIGCETFVFFDSTRLWHQHPLLNSPCCWPQFLAALKTSGIEPGEAWVKNHYRLLVWKAAALELAFPELYSGKRLSAELLFRELVHRFESEAVGKRSFIKAVLERDESPYRHVCLLLCHLHSNSLVEVSDGWYCARARVDNGLGAAILRGTLRPGMKMDICGIEMMNNPKGCSPLECTDKPVLQLNWNCTRRSKWGCKLGLQRNPMLPVSLYSLRADGGPIPTLYARVTKAFPPVFVEAASNGSRIFRSAQAEDVAASKFHAVREAKVLKIQEEVIRKHYQQGQPFAFGESCELAVQRIVSQLEESKDPAIVRNVSSLYRYQVDQASVLAVAAPARRVVLNFWRADADAISEIKPGTTIMLHGLSCRDYTDGCMDVTVLKSTRWKVCKRQPRIEAHQQTIVTVDKSMSACVLGTALDTALCFVACSSLYDRDSRTGHPSKFQDFVFVSQNDCLVIVQADIDSLGWQSSKCFSAGNIYAFHHLVFTGCNAELGALVLSADDFTELLSASKAQTLHKKTVHNVKQDMDRRPWILDNARSFADAVIFSGKQYVPYNHWSHSSCAPCPLVRLHAHSGSCFWIGDALILSDGCSLNQSVELPAGACVVCTCDIGDMTNHISLSDACWMSILEMFEAHCCMADSQFAPLESLSVLRLLEPSDVSHKVADIAAWLNGAVWRVRRSARMFFFSESLKSFRSNSATRALLCCMRSSCTRQAPFGSKARSSKHVEKKIKSRPVHMQRSIRVRLSELSSAREQLECKFKWRLAVSCSSSMKGSNVLIVSSCALSVGKEAVLSCNEM